MRHKYTPNLPAGGSLSASRAFPPPSSREAIEALVESLIAILDVMDGDPDLEDATDAEDDFTFSPRAEQYRQTLGAGCPISDPGGGNVEDELQFDSDNGTDTLATLPLYGVDQSKGPINETIAAQRHQVLSWDRSWPDIDREVQRKLKLLAQREAALPYC